MLQFILNDKAIETELPEGSTVLDFIRYHKRLTGTKIGCREGDCGACTVLVGSLEEDRLVYRSMTSCLMPLGNAAGKHIVSVEGINMKALSPVQQALVDTNGTQCGFCTIGFVMSLTGFVLDEKQKDYDEGIKAIDGNICRCTGYKAIERSIALLTEKISGKPATLHLEWLVENNFIPAYFLNIKERLRQLQATSITPEKITGLPAGKMFIGGGTDLVVQRALAVKRSVTRHLSDTLQLKEITLKGDRCYIGASVTVTGFAESALLQKFFPDLPQFIKLVSSTPIRNMATLAGNLVNASPIGDISVFLLALDATLVLNNGKEKRNLKLKEFYKGYKQIDKSEEEFIEAIFFEPPPKNALFNFEKVCKRTHLDIASVNTACQLQIDESGVIQDIHLAAGGVAPYPKYLAQTVAFLKGKQVSGNVLKEAIMIINNEIAPISDARGSREYKQLLLRQLFLAHFSKQEEMIKQVMAI